MSDLTRFKDAQAYSYDAALLQIKTGRKRGHWMWYISPQIQGLGQSATSWRYAISNLQEAKEYLQDEILGSRLEEISRAALEVESNDPLEVFEYPDNLKLRSSMTLFEAAAPDNELFGKVLDKYFNGDRDTLTLNILAKQAEGIQ